MYDYSSKPFDDPYNDPDAPEEQKILDSVFFNNKFLKVFNNQEQVLTAYSLFKIVWIESTIINLGLIRSICINIPFISHSLDKNKLCENQNKKPLFKRNSRGYYGKRFDK